MVDQLDSADIIDPLQQYRKHFIPDDAEMDNPDEDSRTICEMEMEYARTSSTWEDWHQWDYGDTPTYHAVLSPTMDDDNEMLEGSMADVSPGTEVALLRPVEAGEAPLAEQQTAPSNTTKG